MNTAIIVAAGSSRRMGGAVDKLFLPVAGCPVVGHTWLRLDQLDCVDELVLVVRAGREDEFKKLGAKLGVEKKFHLATGGAERLDSAWNGLQAVAEGTEIVAIQDGARPCTDGDLVARTIAAAREHGAAVACQRVTDTIKEADAEGRIARNIDREKLRAVQTPQAFQLEIIRRALAAVREQDARVTDDTAACELIGQPVILVESDAPNPKVTTPADLPYIESLLRTP